MLIYSWKEKNRLTRKILLGEAFMAFMLCFVLERVAILVEAAFLKPVNNERGVSNRFK